jgi:hypothetical protein
MEEGSGVICVNGRQCRLSGGSCVGVAERGVPLIEIIAFCSALSDI